MVPLGEICDVTIGRTPSRARREFWGSDHPWLSIADMNQGREITATKESITELGARESGSRLIPPGTVLLSFKLSIGKVGTSRIPLYTNEAIAALPINDPDRLTAEWLQWALRTMDLSAGHDRAAMGATLNKAKLLAIQVPLPPLSEQRRIAAILDHADALRTKRREAATQLDQLSQAIFLDMFGDSTRHWPVTTVSELADGRKGAIRTGPFGSQLLKEEFTESGVAVLGIDNATSNTFRWAERRYISEEKYAKLTRYTVHPGDVLITIMGTCGRCVIVPRDIPTAINTKHLCCITLDDEKALPEYLHAYFLSHPEARSYLERTAKGAIMSGLNMGIIKEMPIALAPLDLQMEFARRLAALNLLRSTNESATTELDTLFESLRFRAFRGEL